MAVCEKLLPTFVFVSLVGLFPVLAIEDYCSVNTYTTNGTYMQFTKEPSVEEFAIVGRFKGLHCCAKGYRSIEWYKDGRPYPWPATVSQLILYPESANQTVYTQTVAPDDEGNYTCLLKNDSVVHAHTIQLRVFDKVPDDPKITYVSQNVEARLGQPIRLFCEAFVGSIDLPDAHNDVKWRKAGDNGSLDDEARIRQEKISREENQTFGTYLIIENVDQEDYGEYICTISMPGKYLDLHVFVSEKEDVRYINPNPLPWKNMLLCTAAFVIMGLTVLFLYRQFGLMFRVRMKDNFGQLLENDGKENDVLIVYSQKDSSIAVGVLAPVLETKYHYKCDTMELPTNMNQWQQNLAEPARRSRTILAVLSPSCLNDRWETNIIYHCVKQLQQLGPKLSCIVLKQLPAHAGEVKNSQGETLASVLNSINVIHWGRLQDDTFWLALRLRLPPKRNKQSSVENMNMTQTEVAPRILTDNSQEILDNLV